MDPTRRCREDLGTKRELVRGNALVFVLWNCPDDVIQIDLICCYGTRKLSCSRATSSSVFRGCINNSFVVRGITRDVSPSTSWSLSLCVMMPQAFLV